MFHGSHDDVRADIVQAFSLDGSNEVGLSLSSIVANVSVGALALGNVGSQLGGTVISKEKPATKAPAKRAAPKAKTPEPDEAQTGNDAWSEDDDATPEAAEPEVPVDPNAELLEQIEAATDVASLQRWYGANKAVVTGDVLKAWKAKGKSFSAKKAA